MTTAEIATISHQPDVATDMMDVMLRIPRGTTLAATAVALVGALVGLRLQRWSGRLAPPNTAEPLRRPTPAAGGPPQTTRNMPADDPAPSRKRRVLTWIRRGVTPSACLLWVLGLATGAWAYHLRPESALPRPGPATIELIFGPTHFASAPMKITVRIDQETSQPGTAPYDGMGIYIQSRDLEQPGWKLLAFVPSGVKPLGPLNTPQLGRVTHLATGGDAVYIDPGPAPKGAYGTFLAWGNVRADAGA